MISLLHASRRHARVDNDVHAMWRGRAGLDPDNVQYVLCNDAHSRDTQFFGASNFGYPSSAHVGAVNRGSVDAWNAAARVCTGDVLVQVSDDFEPPQHWDRLILSAVGDVDRPLLLWCSDSVQAKYCTIAIMTRTRLEAQGCFLWPEYISMFSDDDVTAWAAQDCVLRRADHIVFKHRHWLTGERPKDAVDEWQTRDEAWQVGHQVLERRKREGFKPWKG